MVLDALRDLPPAPVLALAFLLPALEASTMLGVVFPGEVALLVAGAAAHAGGAPLWAVLVAGVAGAVLGDLAGYFVGRRWGHALLRRLPRRLVRPAAVERATALIRRRGGPAVFLGRFTALLRALVPGLAGMSGLPLRAFATWNAAGGLLWASGVVLLGYGAGAGLGVVEHRLGLASEVLPALVAAAAVVVWLRHRG
ncbi:DedA family protein [Saccharothrix sp. BKS2]|uniref:DedA family protein n=1 Tax=Saccharothrix sp. BKS2 TaxID=3064400 RepID=UPI0039E81882